MRRTKLDITLDSALLGAVHQLVADQVYPTRNAAIEAAVQRRLQRVGRLARECAKLDPAEELALAEEGLAAELTQWPDS